MIHTVTLNTAVDRTIEVPGLKIGGVLSGHTICEQPAGKGVNVSRCLATLGVPSLAGGFVGAEEAAYFALSFSTAPVRVRFIPVPGRTRRDTTLIDPVAHTDTHIRESGYTVAPQHLDALRTDLQSSTQSGDAVVFCGSLPPGATPDAFAALLNFTRDLGCKVVVDTSAEALQKALAVRPFLMKPNRTELESLMPAARSLDSLADVVAAARSLLETVQTLVVSLGKDGAALICPEGAWHAKCALSPSEVKSTVGCGDAALAGFLAGLEQGRPQPECLRLAVACGSACALTPSAGLIDPADVERLLQKTVLRKFE